MQAVAWPKNRWEVEAKDFAGQLGGIPQMHRLLQIAPLILFLACAGCIAVGDGLLTIRGTLSASDSPSGCSLRLALPEETEARSYNTRVIKIESGCVPPPSEDDLPST